MSWGGPTPPPRILPPTSVKPCTHQTVPPPLSLPLPPSPSASPPLTCSGGACAPLPPAAQSLVEAGGWPLLPRLWGRELGRHTPSAQADLRERVRLAAIQFIYEQELQVGVYVEVGVGGGVGAGYGWGWGCMSGHGSVHLQT